MFYKYRSYQCIPVGVESGVCPPCPQRDRKRRLIGAVCRNRRIKRVVLADTLKNPAKCLWRGSPTVGPTSSVRLHIYVPSHTVRLILTLTILFYSILRTFYSILFYSVFSILYSILSCCSILYYALFCILFYNVFYSILFYLAPYSIIFYFVFYSVSFIKQTPNFCEYFLT